MAAIHASRKPLLRWRADELSPLAVSRARSSLFGSSGASLHTKAFIVDNNTVFVGSYNLDPRSTWLNCEQGVLVEDEALATQLRSVPAQQIDGQHAWKVSLAVRRTHLDRRSRDIQRGAQCRRLAQVPGLVCTELSLDAQL